MMIYRAVNTGNCSEFIVSYAMELYSLMQMGANVHICDEDMRVVQCMFMIHSEVQHKQEIEMKRRSR